MNFLLFITVIALTYFLVNAINVWYIKPYEHLKEKYDELQRSYQATFECLTIHENDIKKLRKELATTRGQLTKLRKLYDRQDNTKIKK